MIAFVRGQVAAVTLNSAVLDVGGIGLELMCTPGTLATLRTGQTATLPTSMVVREDSLTIFGFLDEDEKVCFELVQTASGVGPKLAQAIVAVMSPDDVRRAITTEDVQRLKRRLSDVVQKKRHQEAHTEFGEDDLVKLCARSVRDSCQPVASRSICRHNHGTHDEQAYQPKVNVNLDVAVMGLVRPKHGKQRPHLVQAFA